MKILFVLLALGLSAFANEDEEMVEQNLGIKKCECMFVCKGEKEGAVQGDCELSSRFGYHPSQEIELKIAQSCIPSVTDDRMCYGLEN